MAINKSLFLKTIYLKSLTPFELLDLSKQTKEKLNKEQQVLYLNFWKKSVSKYGDETSFNEYCLANKLDIADISLMTSYINGCNNEIKLPLWVSTLNSVLNNIDLNKKEENKPFYRILSPFIDFFSFELEQKTKNIEKDFLDIKHIFV